MTYSLAPFSNIGFQSSNENVGSSIDSEHLYELDLPSGDASTTPRVRAFVATTPYSRTICNDPLCCGIDYTRFLQAACTSTLLMFNNKGYFDSLTESNTTVFNLLRGGLNFGLRDACADAFGWSFHNTAFASAQRRKTDDSGMHWEITEESYRKVHPHSNQALFLGDVVGSGTSMAYALDSLIEEHQRHSMQITHLVFFTIGTEQTLRVAGEYNQKLADAFPNFKGFTVVFFEGVFRMATSDFGLSIALPGTDLLRGNGATLAPEFLESQKKHPSFALERCAIYDAGSRAFDVATYLADVREYWSQVLRLAEGGMTLQQYRKERLSEHSEILFTATESLPALAVVAAEQIAAFDALPVPKIAAVAE